MFKKVVLKRWNESYKSLSVARDETTEALSQLQAKHQKIVELFVEDKITYNDKELQLSRLNADRIAMKLRLNELNQDVDDKETIIDLAIDFMTNADRYWSVAPVDVQRAVQDLILPNGIEYEFGAGFGTAFLSEAFEVAHQASSSVVGVPGLEPGTNRL